MEQAHGQPATEGGPRLLEDLDKYARLFVDLLYSCVHVRRLDDEGRLGPGVRWRRHTHRARHHWSKGELEHGVVLY